MRDGLARTTIRLTSVFALVGLLSSRLGLLVHEFLGHGGVAYGLGGTLPHWRLFFFGGGWIQYERTPWYSLNEALAISLAGVALELVVAIIAWCLSDWMSRSLGGLAGQMLRVVALLLCAHSCFYIVTGLHYGYGDGVALRSALSSTARIGLVIALSAALCALAFLLAIQALRITAAFDARAGVRRIALASGTIVLASTLLLGLYASERFLTDPDQTYEAIMKKEVERRAEEHVAILRTRQLDRGQEWRVVEEPALRDAFIEQHRPWPLRPVLIALCLLCAGVGARRHAEEEQNHSLKWHRTSIATMSVAVLVLLLTIGVVDSFG